MQGKISRATLSVVLILSCIAPVQAARGRKKEQTQQQPIPEQAAAAAGAVQLQPAKPSLVSKIGGRVGDGMRAIMMRKGSSSASQEPAADVTVVATKDVIAAPTAFSDEIHEEEVTASESEPVDAAPVFGPV